jgi:transcriptional regulator with PAS, ATPase and Fis domain
MYGMNSETKEVRQRALVEIGSALRRHGGDVSGTADYLEVGRATLHRWLKAEAYLQRVLESARVRGPE